MKLLLEILIAKKVVWAVVSLAWRVGPILYIFLADGDLW